MKTVVCSH